MRPGLAKEVNILEENPDAEASLDVAGTSLRAIRVSDEQKVALWNLHADFIKKSYGSAG
jgi:hypothetical protein